MSDISSLTNQNVFDIIQMCDNALLHLTYANTYLSSAGNWGVVDILGGGLFSSIAKHSKMDDAKREIETSKYAIKQLKAYLDNVDLDSLSINNSDFFAFADLFFDGFISDWLIQSRIRDAQAQVNDAIVQISSLKSVFTAYSKEL